MTQLIIIIIYLVALLGLAAFSNRLFRGTTKDYMLASHSIGPFLLVMSLFGTTMTAFALVGSTGKSFTTGVGVYGMLASASGIVHPLCFFLVGLPLWAHGRRHGHTTQIEFFRDRLDNKAIGFILFPILVALVIPYLLVGINGAGVVISGVTTGSFGEGQGVPKWLASLVICLVVLTYVFLGGMRGTAWANAFQTLVFIILGVVTFLAIANNLGKKDSLYDNLKAATTAVMTPDESASPDVKLKQLERGADRISRRKLPWTVYFSFLFIPLSVAMFPHVFQHWLTAKSAGSFRAPIVLHPLLIMIVWVPCVLVGVWATAPSSGIPADTKLNDVLPMMVANLNQPVLTGLLSAGILAAIMSSLDSQFLCVGTMFTKDVVLQVKDESSLSQSQQVTIARCFVVFVVALTYTLNLIAPRNVFAMSIWCFSGFTALFPLVIAALYWRRLTAIGAISSVVAMSAAWIWMFVQSDYAGKPFSFPAKAWEWPVPSFMPVVSLTVLSTVVMVVVSLVTRPPNEETIKRYFS